MPETSLPLTESRRAWARGLLDGMSLAEAAGQLLAGAFFREPLKPALPLFKAGKLGAILPAPANMPDPATTRDSIERADRGAAVPVLGTADFEAGTGLMLGRGGTRFPPAMARGAQATPEARLEAVRETARATAREALAMGVRLNFAPVADLATHPSNAAINTRSFGSDPGLVSELVAEQIRASQEAGLACAAKHFPGHGPVVGDSHLHLPVCELSAERLERVELAPFRAAIQAGALAVMAAHVHYPALQPKAERKRQTPASLSRALLGDWLRGRMGFEGLVVSDSLAMAAVANGRPPGGAAVEALRAGCDLLIVESGFEACHSAILEAVGREELSEERVREAALRVLELKARVGLSDSPGAPSGLDACGTPEHSLAALRIARGAVALASGSVASLRASLARGARPNVLGFFNAGSAGAHGSPALLAAALGSGPGQALALRDDSPPEDHRRAAEMIASPEPLVAVLFRRPVAYRPEGLGLTLANRRLFDRATQSAAALVVQGAPFRSPEWGWLPGELPMIVAYGTDAACSLAAAEAILGKIEPQPYREPWPPEAS